MIRQILKLSVFSIASLILTACETSKPRNLAANHHYNYTDSYNCKTSAKAFSDKIYDWSPLSGYSVGPQISFQDPSEKILRPFTSDGCSQAPDGLSVQDNKKWIHCCVAHDVAFWMGGSADDNKQSLKRFGQCIADTGSPKVAEIYQYFVGKFGGPETQATYRWGYGWNYNRNFAALTEAEKAQAEKLYGLSIQDLIQQLKGETELVQPCSTWDVIFKGLNKAERSVYQHLNQNLKSADIIEWGLRGSIQNGLQTYEIKLKSCKEPVTYYVGSESLQIKQVVRPICAQFPR